MTAVRYQYGSRPLSESKVYDLSGLHTELFEPSDGRAFNRKNGQNPIHYHKGLKTNVDNAIHFYFPPSNNNVIIT